MENWQWINARGPEQAPAASVHYRRVNERLMDAISTETCCVSLARNQTAQKLEKDAWQIVRALHVFHVRVCIQHRGTSGHAAAVPPAKFRYA